MLFKKESFEAKRDKRLRLTTVPSTNGKPSLQIYSLDKRKIAEELIERFTRFPKESDTYDFRKLDLSNANLAGLNLRALGEKALRQVDFTGSNLPGQNFAGLNLRGARFKGAHMEGTHFERATLEGANMDGVFAARSNFEGTKATGVRLNKANLDGSNLNGCFNGAQMNEARAVNANIGDGRFEKASMRRITLTGAFSEGTARFCHADMTESKLDNVDLKGADFTNSKLTRARMTDSDFQGAKFAKAEISGIKTDDSKLDSKAFDQALHSDLDRNLEIALPKPSFNSKVMRVKALLNKAGPEAPTMDQAKDLLEKPRPSVLTPEQAQAQNHVKLLKQFPHLDPFSG